MWLWLSESYLDRVAGRRSNMEQIGRIWNTMGSHKEGRTFVISQKITCHSRSGCLHRGWGWPLWTLAVLVAVWMISFTSTNICWACRIREFTDRRDKVCMPPVTGSPGVIKLITVKMSETLLELSGGSTVTLLFLACKYFRRFASQTLFSLDKMWFLTFFSLSEEWSHHLRRSRNSYFAYQLSCLH